MSRIKVVFSVGAMHGGGSERQLVSLLRHLDRDRFEPLLYLVYRTGPLLTEVPDDVPVTSFEDRFGPPRGPGFLMHRKRVADMSRFLSECGAHVSYDRTFLMTLIAAAAAQRIGVPNVSTIVTDPPIGFPLVAGRFQWMKKRILRRLYRQSACVLANSCGAAQSAERFYGLPPGTVHVQPNGVDLQQVRQKSELPIQDAWWNSPAPSSSRSPSPRLFRIVTAGRLDQKKGFHLLIEAVRVLSERGGDVSLRLAILGEGPCRSALQEQIQAAGLQNQIRLPGFRPEAPAWYRSADLFVLPSLLEGMPNVLLEAMACGTPVLSTDCRSGPQEILAGGQFGALCAVNSVPALIDGIQKFLADETAGTRYTSAATGHVQSHFSIESAVRRLEDVFQTVATHGEDGTGVV